MAPASGLLGGSIPSEAVALVQPLLDGGSFGLTGDLIEQPADARVQIGGTAVFSASAEGAGLSAQWRISDDAGATWRDIPGATRAVTVGETTRTWYSVATGPGWDGRRFRAVFVGDDPDASQASRPAVLNLERAPSAITVETSANPRRIGDPLTITVLVAAGAPGAPSPDGGLARVAIGPLTFSATLVDGRATFAIPDTLDEGTYAFHAEYDGDAYAAPAAKTLDPIVVQRGGSRIDAEVPSESTLGRTVTMTAYVEHWAPEGYPTPGGVVFMDGGAPIGFEQLVRQSDGRYLATFRTSRLAEGNHYFQLVYLGNYRTYAASTGIYMTTVRPAGAAIQSSAAVPSGPPAPSSPSPIVAAASARGSGASVSLNADQAGGDPFPLLSTLTAGLDNSFGLSISASSTGDLLAVGAFQDVDDTAGGTGSASVFTRSGDDWTRTAQLSAPEAQNFGFDVAISADGSTLVVGAPLTPVGARTSQGAVYVYERTGEAWNLVQVLTATDGRAGDRFGYSVAVNADGRVIAVGAERGGGVAQAANKVSAYVFSREEGVWSERAELEPAEGTAVALNYTVGVELSSIGDVLLIHALAFSPSGIAAIYSETAGTWTRDLFLNAKTFPGVVGLSGRAGLSPDGATAALGASIGTSSADERPAVLVVSRSGSGWTEAAILTAPAEYGSDMLGHGTMAGAKLAFSPDGATLFAGAPGTSVGGLSNAGAIHVFERSGAGWAHVMRLTEAAGEAEDNFGTAVVAADGVVFASSFRPALINGRSRGIVRGYGDARLSAAIEPAGQSVSAGSPATFTAEARGTFASVQWQTSGDGGLNWTDVPGATGLALTIQAEPGDSGRLVRAVFTRSGGGVETSLPATLTVVERRVDLGIQIHDNPRRVGDPLQVVVLVGAVEPSATVPGGLIRLTIGTMEWTAPVVDGRATFQVPTTLAVGDHVVRASYPGDGRFAPSDAAAPLTVMRGTSTLSAAVPTTASAGTVVAVTVVVGHSGTVAPPSGGVMFMDGGRPIAFIQVSADPDGRIVARFSTAALAPGDHYFQMVYLGDPRTFAATSGVFKLTVASAPAPAPAPARTSHEPVTARTTVEEARPDSMPAPAPSPPARVTTNSVVAGLPRFQGRMRMFASARRVAEPLKAPGFRRWA